jgi:hypothetical protein
MNVGTYVFSLFEVSNVVREGASLCSKILNDQHRGMSLNSDEMQNALDERRRMSMAGIGGGGQY